MTRLYEARFFVKDKGQLIFLGSVELDANITGYSFPLTAKAFRHWRKSRRATIVKFERIEARSDEAQRPYVG